MYVLETPLFRVRNRKETIYCYSYEEKLEAMDKIGKNPEQQKSGLKVKNRVLCIQLMIRENNNITPNQVLEKMNDYNKADLRYDIQNGYFTF